MEYFEPYHQWEVLRVGESIVVPLPVIDLVPVQERMLAVNGKVFSLYRIPVDNGPYKTRVERVS